MDNSNDDDVMIIKIVRKTNSKKEMIDKTTQTEILEKESKIHVSLTDYKNQIVQNEECLLCETVPNANASKSPKTETESNYIILKEYEKQVSSNEERLAPKKILNRTKTVSIDGKSESNSSESKHSVNQLSCEEYSPFKKDLKIVHGSDAIKRMRIVSPRSDKPSSKECSPPKKYSKIIHESDLLERMRTVSPRNNNTSDLQILSSDPGFKNKIDTEMNSFAEKSESKDILIVEHSNNEPSSKECSPSQKYSKAVHESELLKGMRTVSPRNNNSSDLQILTSDPGFIEKIDLKRTEMNSFAEKSESEDLLIVELSDNEPSSKECSPSQKYSKLTHGSDLLKLVRTVSSRSNNSLDLPSLTSDRGFIDTHCHLDFLFERQNFRGTHAEYLELHKDTYPSNYEGCVTVFCDPFSFQKKEIWQAYLKEEGVWAAFGCHPKNAKYYDDHIESALCSALLHSKVRALGEIGLDYSERNYSPKSMQHKVLKRQIRIALDLNLPLVIHCRDATDDCMRILKEFVPRDHHIHLHCFNEGWNIAHEWLRAFPNLFIGLTNLVTYPSARAVHEVAKHISLKRLLLETDAPYFLPKKGFRCSRFSHPGMAIHVATEVAAIREMSVAEVLYWTRQNTFKMGLKTFLKLFIAVPIQLFCRKCKVSGQSFLALLLIAIGSLYISTSLYSLSIDKIQPATVSSVSSAELFNETSYTETPIIVNTETSNVMIRKQQVNKVYERPVLENEKVSVLQNSVAVGEIVPNCGLDKVCGKDEFSVHLYTGNGNKDEPRLCIDSKYVISRDVNEAGRGMNVAVVDNFTRTIIRVSHFDTYDKESTNLETLLLTLRPGDIVIMITFDESSRKLSRIARLLLFDLGSGLVQNLSYRGSWYLITQKGISGFTPFEDLHFVENNGWPIEHDLKLCVPFEIHGTYVHPDPMPHSNPQRVEFCEKYEDLPMFCDGDVVNDPLVPAPVWKQPAAINKIYDVPIIVMSGDNVQFLPLTLETLVRQPGVKPNMVLVFYLPQNKMVQNLSELFGFMSEELSPSPNHCDRVSEAFEITRLIFPELKDTLLIGEKAILAPDFLFYFGQLLSILNVDDSIISVSALNENGYKSLSGDSSVAYRVESFSALAILVRKDFFKKSWCRNESVSDPLFISSDIKGVSLIPDVSRVTLASATSDKDVSSYYLSHDRTITYEQNIALKSPEKLQKGEYHRQLERDLSSMATLVFDAKSLVDCLQKKEQFQSGLLENLSMFLNSTLIPGKTMGIFVHQDSIQDITTMQQLCQCIGLFHHPHYPVRGLYKGVLRFMLKDNPAVIVGSKSPFFKFKPRSAPVLKFDKHIGTLNYIR
ncbi:hypothetical protein JTE90_000882 [Oedothorax gibbosus]|uniref:ILEI/PANDER domain-containing protein n=1 Tax=Oedothorax gibbosus TaxID=931172 RepID=A0AAV6VT06_9ARAC|nr:hypothetical protein JTE90_000882 [Oedothorax gibbosus]